MKLITRFIPAISAVFFGFALLGFYSHNNSNPEDIGLYRAKIDDRGLLELAIDRVRQAVKAGRPELIRNLKTPDYQDLSTQAEQDFFVTGPSGRASFSKKISIIDNISDRMTQVRISTENGAIDLTFEKIDDQWKLKSSAGLMQRRSNSIVTADRTNAEYGYVLYREPASDETRTLMRTALNPDHDVEKLTKTVTRDRIERELFEKPYAGVLVSSVTQLNHAPYFIAQYVQLVTDPAWNRIVYGDYDGWIKAYGNSGVALEDLNRPHGIDRDSEGRIYVADTGNHRIVVLGLEGSKKETELEFGFAFGSDQLMHPYDVAWDDQGTPFDSADDVIWVADSGNHRIIGYSLNGRQASVRYVYGEYGTAEGMFLQPTSLSVGRFNGIADGNIYVADSGNRRIVKLAVLENHLSWIKSYHSKEESQFTSIDVDHWGNIYVTDRSYLEIHKLTSDLELLDSIKGDETSIVHPVNFHVIFGRVEVPSENRQIWAGYDQAFLLEKWTDTSGGERYELGVELKGFTVSLSEDLSLLSATTKLTDHSNISVALIEAGTHRTVRQIPAGWLLPGDREISWDRRDDLGWQVEPGFYRMQLSAESSYESEGTFKETPEFYVPLYYHEDSGSDIYRDAHLVQGQRNTEWGTEPYESIATHPSEVVYRFTDLNPNVDYEIKAEFFNRKNGYLKQRLTIDGAVIVEDFEIPAGTRTVDWVTLPREVYADGGISIAVEKIEGDLDAMISQLWLREADYDPKSSPILHDQESQIPESYTLSQNYPNPFNPTTTIEFGIPETANEPVTLKIVNMLGQTVNVLVDKSLAPGRHTVVWNGRDAYGRQISSGVYFYQLKAGDFIAVKKLIMMK